MSERLTHIAYQDQVDAARALLAALKEFHAICNDSPQDEFVYRLYRLFNRVGKTIAQAEAAGITTEGGE